MNMLTPERDTELHNVAQASTPASAGGEPPLVSPPPGGTPGELAAGTAALQRQASCLFHPDLVEPWPDAVDGALLLDQLATLLTRFVVLPAHAAETLALWILHTYAFELRDVTTYLGLVSPEKRCGKTTLLGILSELVHRPVVAANISPSAFFRVIEEIRPTLLIDEADTFLQGNDELRGILNSGYHRKTAFVVRVGYTPTPDTRQSNAPSTPDTRYSSLHRFSSWCPKVMAAIGRLPETLADRCIVIKMQRKTHREQCERSRDLDALQLRRCCVRFVHDNASLITRSHAEIPPGLNDRAADIWEPLLLLADLAGGPWPGKAREAAVALSASAEESTPIGSLLFDILVGLFMAPDRRIFSRDLVDHLNHYLDRPWAEPRNAKPITEIWLARQLRPYGIAPKTIRIEDETGKGYHYDQFDDVFRRYMPKSEVDHYKAQLQNREPEAASRCPAS